MSGWITSGFTGHELKSNHFTPARMSAPRATLCYPALLALPGRSLRDCLSLSLRYRTIRLCLLSQYSRTMFPSAPFTAIRQQKTAASVTVGDLKLHAQTTAAMTKRTVTATYMHQPRTARRCWAGVLLHIDRKWSSSISVSDTEAP